MKLNIDRSVFSKALNLVSAATAVRDVKPILQNVKMTTQGNSILLQATDFEVGIRIRVDDCEVREEGEVMLPAKKLQQILSECKEKSLTFSDKDEKIIVNAGRNQFSLLTQSANEFPDIEQFNAGKYHQVDASSLADAIFRTVIAADTDNTKYALGGVLLEMEGEEIHVVATDGRRMAYQLMTGTDFGGHKSNTTILPTKPLQILARCIDGAEETCRVNICSTRAIFECGPTTFFVRLIEGRFPRWQTIIPKTTGRQQIDISAGMLYSAIRQAAVVTNDKKPGVDFSFTDGLLRLNGQGDEIGNSEIELPIEYSGKEISVRFDPKFFVQFLNALDNNAILHLFVAKDEPILGQTDDGYFHIIMPLS